MSVAATAKRRRRELTQDPRSRRNKTRMKLGIASTAAKTPAKKLTKKK